MNHLDVQQLDKQIKDVVESLRKLAADQEWEELLSIIRRPGWTTPPEFRFASGLADVLAMQVKGLEETKHVLIEGSRMVGRTPAAAG